MEKLKAAASGALIAFICLEIALELIFDEGLIICFVMVLGVFMAEKTEADKVWIFLLVSAYIVGFNWAAMAFFAGGALCAACGEIADEKFYSLKMLFAAIGFLAAGGIIMCL